MQRANKSENRKVLKIAAALDSTARQRQQH